jgi:hypothetical protein
MPPTRPIKRRRAIIWFDDDDWPTAWTMQWYLNGDLETELGGGVASGIDVAELLGILDQLPQKVHPSVIDDCGWSGPYDAARGTHRYKVDLPGWAETNKGHNWYLPVQMRLVD